MFGGLSPLPLRLGGDALNGLTAAQHARLCADLVAAVRACPFAWVTYTASAGVVTVHACNSMQGIGIEFYPAALYNSTGDVTLSWPESVEDPYFIGEPVHLRFAKATCHGATARRAAIQSAPGGNSVRIVTRGKASGVVEDCKVTVRVS